MNLDELRAFDRPEFYTPWWRARMDDMETVLADGIPDDFLDVKAVADCGLVTNHERAPHWEVDRMGYLPPPEGHPHPNTALHHGAIVNHVVPDGATVVEFGGGFGSMAHIASAYLDVTWVIVDSPVMASIQHAYLSRVATEPNWYPYRGAHLGAVNLVGHTVAADTVDYLGGADVFIGTWSVSEASTACHDWLCELDWFGAPVVFLAADLGKPDDFEPGCELVERLGGEGFDVVEAPFEGSVYVTRGVRW